MKPILKSIKWILLIIVVAGVGFTAKRYFTQKKDDVNLGKVERKDLLQKVTVAGTIVPNRRTVFNAAFNGYVRKIYVKVGDHVKEGSPIVSIVQSLAAVSSEVYPMLSPISGEVVQILKTEGEYVDSTKGTMVRVDDLSHLFIWSDVPEADIDKVKIGQKAIIKVTAVQSRTYRGVIREIFRAAREVGDWIRNSDRSTFQVKMEILDNDKDVMPGMSAIIDIITGERKNVLTLAHEYVEEDEGKFFVNLESGEKRPVEVGLRNDEMFEITKGANEGDHVKMVDFLSLGDKRG